MSPDTPHVPASAAGDGDPGEGIDEATVVVARSRPELDEATRIVSRVRQSAPESVAIGEGEAEAAAEIPAEAPAEACAETPAEAPAEEVDLVAADDATVIVTRRAQPASPVDDATVIVSRAKPPAAESADETVVVVRRSPAVAKDRGSFTPADEADSKIAAALSSSDVAVGDRERYEPRAEPEQTPVVRTHVSPPVRERTTAQGEARAMRRRGNITLFVTVGLVGVVIAALVVAGFVLLGAQ